MGIAWGLRALHRKGRKNRAPVCWGSAASELQFALSFRRDWKKDAKNSPGWLRFGFHELC